MTYEIMMIRQSGRLLNNHVVSELSSSAIFNIIKFQPVSMETKRLKNGYLFIIFWLTNGYTTLIMSIEIIFNHVRILMF